MIKFTATDKETGVPLIGLGLSARNIQLLMAGKPIHIKLNELDPKMRGEILLMYGTTEDAMAEALKDWITPDTIVHHNQDPNKEHSQ